MNLKTRVILHYCNILLFLKYIHKKALLKKLVFIVKKSSCLQTYIFIIFHS